MTTFTRVLTESGAQIDVSVDLIKAEPQNYNVVDASDLAPYARPTIYPGSDAEGASEIAPETAALLETLAAAETSELVEPVLGDNPPITGSGEVAPVDPDAKSGNKAPAKTAAKDTSPATAGKD